jgi:hypothetical protein
MRKTILISLFTMSVLAAPTWALAQDEVTLELHGPKAVLTRVPFTLGFTAPESAFDLVEWRLVRVRDGELVGSGTVEPGIEVEIEGIRIDRGSDLPLRLEVAGRAGHFSVITLPGWFSILPPLVAIALALIFKEVVVSLFAGVWLGAFFVAGLNPFAALFRTIDTFIMPSLADGDHASIVIFSLLLGGMVGLMGRSGGTHGIVEAVAPLATNRRRGQLSTFLAGLLIFFDDYANTLIVGNTLRPITDRLNISREKLSYLVDSTAAPVAAIVFVSTWAGYQISLIGDGLGAAAEQVGAGTALGTTLGSASPFATFIGSIPYLFYPILALCMVFLVAWTGRDFGPMLKAEQRASRGDGLYRDGAMLMVDTSAELMAPKEGKPRKWFNAAIPVATVVIVVLLGLYIDGRSALGHQPAHPEATGSDGSMGRRHACDDARRRHPGVGLVVGRGDGGGGDRPVRKPHTGNGRLPAPHAPGLGVRGGRRHRVRNGHVVGDDGDLDPSGHPAGGDAGGERRDGGRRVSASDAGNDQLGAGRRNLRRSLLADLGYHCVELDGIGIRSRRSRSHTAAVRTRRGSRRNANRRHRHGVWHAVVPLVCTGDWDLVCFPALLRRARRSVDVIITTV